VNLTWIAVQRQAIECPGTASDVVGVIAFLSSDDASSITGQTIMAARSEREWKCPAWQWGDLPALGYPNARTLRG
jgi:hypothetical protein